MRVAIVIPAYNEGRVIRGVVQKLQRTLKKSAYVFQVIVVDDGSKDNTADEARRGGAYVISHLLNSGSASDPTATGLAYARQHNFDIACVCDGDGQHDPADVLKGIELLGAGGVDLLIGSRLLSPAGMSRLKRIGNKGLTLLTFLLFGTRVTDSQSGLRVLSRQALVQLRWKTTGYEFCSEMLWRAKQLGLVIGEYPIRAIYTDYSKAKGQNNWNAVNIIKILTKQRVLELFSE